MKRHLCAFAFAGLLSGGFALAQQPPPGSTPPTFPRTQQQTTPPTFPQDQQEPVPPTRPEIQPPAEAPPPATSPTADLQIRVQDAIRQQLPASADQVKVSVADDGSLELRGAVSTDRERQQIEDVARSAAPNHTIVDKLTVNGSVSGMSSRGSAQGESQQTGVEKPKTGQNITPPNRGDEDWPQTGSSTTQQSANPEATMTPASPSVSQGTTPAQSSTTTQNSSSAQMGQASALPQSDQTTNSLQGTIQSALQQDPALANSSVTVNVTGNKIELTGTAPDQHAKKTAEDIAKTNSSGRKVVDHIKIKMKSNTSSATPY